MRNVDRQLLEAAGLGDAIGVQAALLGGACARSRGDQGRSATMSSALRGDEGSLRLLLDAGADPRAADDLGRTCLMYAAMGRGRSFSMLIAAGADPAAVDARGESALAYAAAAQFEPMIASLLSMGAQIAEAQAIWSQAQAERWAGIAALAKAWVDAAHGR